VAQASLTIGLVAETVWLRRRVAALRVLTDAASAAVDGGGHRLLKAAGVRLDPATIAAARAHAVAEGLAAVDLVPRDLGVAQALDLLREVDPASYCTDRLTRGRGACHAVLADEGVLRAAAVSLSARGTASDLAKAMITLKLHAPADCDLVVAPRLTTAQGAAARAPQVLAVVHGRLTGFALAPRLVWIAALLASGVFGRRCRWRSSPARGA
jgi:hypothetical protein